MAKKRTGLTRQGEATRNAIIAAAEKHFALQGFAATRLEDIADDANIRAATLLYYFSSKQALYDEMDKAIFLSAEALITSYLANCSSPHDRLVGLINAWLDFLVSRPTAARIYQRNLAGSSMQHPPREFSGPAKERFVSIIRDGQASSAFKDINPGHILYIIGGGIVNFVCLETWNNNSIPEQAIASFRKTLHSLAHSPLATPE